jgi:hypothetical protein
MIRNIIYIMALTFTPDIIQGFSTYFKRCVRGYHLVNLDPIKESVWESINCQVLAHSGGTIFSKSDGSHSPGSDISSSVGNFSNKSVKYESSDHSHFNISSYRLTSVCSFGEPGEINNIIAEINKRKNFQYYSIIAREETNDKIHYDWFILPADHPALNPVSYEWSPLLGKRGKKKDEQIGWITNIVNGSKMSITFSMSSQLWISVNVTEEMKSLYIVASSEVKKAIMMDYVQLSDKFQDDNN